MKDFCIQLQIFFLDWRNTVYPFNVVNSPVKDREVLEKKTVSLSDMWCQKKKDNCDIHRSEICIFNSL